jgi:hypothetical protein
MPHNTQVSGTVSLGGVRQRARQGSIQCGFRSRPNQGLELTGNSVRSSLAPAAPRSSGPALGLRTRRLEKRPLEV